LRHRPAEVSYFVPLPCPPLSATSDDPDRTVDQLVLKVLADLAIKQRFRGTEQRL
jgi:hypothetical protein